MNTKKITQFTLFLIFFLSVGSLTKAQNQPPKNEIKFTRFSVSTDKKRIAIDWATDNAVATNYFEIQKSLDGVNFKTIALVLGPDPKQPAGDSYGYLEKYIAKNAKHAYYRLRHIDINGAEQISETKLLSKNI